jgi:hypothetical protein
MKPSVRIRICSVCGPVLVRSAPRSTYIVFDTNSVWRESRRPISWPSFFKWGLKNDRDRPKSANLPKPAGSRNVDEFKAKTAKKVQRLREEKEKPRRQALQSRPSGALKSVLYRGPPPRSPERPLLSKPKAEPSVKLPQKLLPEDISRLIFQQRDQTQSRRKLVEQISSKKTIFTPYRDVGARGRDARDVMKAYFEMLPNGEPLLPPTKPLMPPWEEEPIGEDEKMKTLRSLLKLIPPRSGLVDTKKSTSVPQVTGPIHDQTRTHTPKKVESTHPRPAEQQSTSNNRIDLAQNKIPTPAEHILQAFNFEEILKSSPLYQHLRKHHYSISLSGNTNSTVEIPHFHRVLAFSQEWLGNKRHRVDSFLRDWNVLCDCPSHLTVEMNADHASGLSITPLIRYILLSQGFNMEHFLVTNDIDHLRTLKSSGRFKSSALHELVIDRKMVAHVQISHL